MVLKPQIGLVIFGFFCAVLNSHGAIGLSWPHSPAPLALASFWADIKYSSLLSLLKASGHYAKLWNMQSGGFLPQDEK
ncbi:hypothetical protein [Rickettsiales endosymbiont of Stachyamoeba lipophora]|uniref:hypothetical protein n=1 Tax=Rickettsiales endosymbiont of Stachyamoeba lipophora TaxID=2486578 RepID=UPI000F652654|nr:hypothetical protein [Rickettsiales endosymbiont of Stachyamoeba lipophora]AZL16349.1 hypothetical protein EF513_07410 [Rickettsiales endosymbiont of Stachyamoeba lipophora]